MRVVIKNSAPSYFTYLNPKSLKNCIDSGAKCWVFNQTQYSLKTIIKNWWETPSQIEYVTTIKNAFEWKEVNKTKSKFIISPRVNFENYYELKEVPHVWKLNVKVNAFVKLENWDRKFLGSKKKSIIIVPEYLSIITIISIMSLWFVYYRQRRFEDLLED